MKVLGRLTALSIVLACTACSGNPKADLPWPVRPTGELLRAELPNDIVLVAEGAEGENTKHQTPNIR